MAVAVGLAIAVQVKLKACLNGAGTQGGKLKASTLLAGIGNQLCDVICREGVIPERIAVYAASSGYLIEGLTIACQGHRGRFVALVDGIILNLNSLLTRFDTGIIQRNRFNIAVTGAGNGVNTGCSIKCAAVHTVGQPFDGSFCTVFIHGLQIQGFADLGNKFYAAKGRRPSIRNGIGMIANDGNRLGRRFIGYGNRDHFAGDGGQFAAGSDCIIVVRTYFGNGGHIGFRSRTFNGDAAFGGSRSVLVPLIGDHVLAIQRTVLMLRQNSQGRIFITLGVIDRVSQIGLPGKALVSDIRLHGNSNGINLVILAFLRNGDDDLVIGSGAQAAFNSRTPPVATLSLKNSPFAADKRCNIGFAALGSNRGSFGCGYLDQHKAAVLVAHIVQDGR